MIEVDLSKNQALNANPRVIQQIIFTTNFHCAGNTRIFSFLKKLKELPETFHKER